MGAEMYTSSKSNLGKSIMILLYQVNYLLYRELAPLTSIYAHFI